MSDDGLYFSRLALRGKVVTDVRPWNEGEKRGVAIFVDGKDEPALVIKGTA